MHPLPQYHITFFVKLADFNLEFLAVGAAFITLKFNDVGDLCSRPW
jgi:hypothetical protein